MKDDEIDYFATGEPSDLPDLEVEDGFDHEDFAWLRTVMRHEAGHAVAGWLIAPQHLISVTVNFVGHAWGTTEIEPEWLNGLQREDPVRWGVIVSAGIHAQHSVGTAMSAGEWVTLLTERREGDGDDDVQKLRKVWGESTCFAAQASAAKSILDGFEDFSERVEMLVVAMRKKAVHAMSNERKIRLSLEEVERLLQATS